MLKKSLCGFVFAAAALTLLADDAPATGPYKVEKTVKVGGDGGFDYVNADSAGRRLYVARGGKTPRIVVYDLDSLDKAGEIADTQAHGAVVSTKTHHAFGSSKPIAMWDSKTLEPIKKIDVEGSPDGMLHDAFNDRVYVFSHRAPNVTVINPADGSIVKTLDLGGAPEQAASDGKGHIYVDIEDKDNIAVIDAKELTVTAHYDLQGKGGVCAGLAMDVKNHLLFATCRKPQTMVVMDARDGKILAALPIGAGTDGAVFNPKTKEAFSSQGDGTLTIVKEKSPAEFEVEQNLETMRSAKTMTLDEKTGKIYLIAAEFGPPPAAQPGGRAPSRGPMIEGSFSIVVVGK